jgi:hypothetical protein
LCLGYINFIDVISGAFSTSFQLVGLQNGSSDFGLQVHSLTDFFGGVSFEVEPVTERVVGVSAPATLGLFAIAIAIAILGLAEFRRKA